MKLPIPRWELGTVLYQKVDPETGGMLTGYSIRPGSATSYTITYVISWGDGEERCHWEFELTDEKTYSGSAEEQ